MVTSPTPLLTSGRRAPRRPWWRWLGMLGLLAAAVVVVVALLAGVVWSYAWLRLGPSSFAALEEELTVLGAEPASSPPGATTLLVVVTEPVVDRTVPGEPALAAPVMLVQFGGPREVPAAVVLPENLPVAAEGEQLLTLAQIQASGGVDGIVRAVGDYAGMRPDHVVAATTELMPSLTAALGPIERCGVTGCREVTPDDARLLLSQGSPEERIEATVQLLGDLARQVEGVRALREPLTARRVVDAVAAGLDTDVSLRGVALLRVASVLSEPHQVQIARIEAETDPETGELIVLPERAEIRFQQLRDGSPLPPDEPDEPDEPGHDGVDAPEAPEPDAEQPSLAVLNGAGVPGLAGDVRARLEANGFAVIGTGNAEVFDRALTEVGYLDVSSAAQQLAEEVATRLGDVVVVPVPGGPRFEGEPVDVLVTVGADLDPAGAP